jgi:hypothetical protein
MSWAARRETTRIEDMAYSLLGIFGVHMPLLYGEGENAFIRLQEEIMKISGDSSLLAWSWNPVLNRHFSVGDIRNSVRYGSQSELLAKSPADFSGCHSITAINDVDAPAPFMMTNIGLQIRLPVVDNYRDIKLDPSCILGLLSCRTEDEPHYCLGLVLRSPENTPVYRRVRMKDDRVTIAIPTHVAAVAEVREIWIKKNWDSGPSETELFRALYPALSMADLSVVVSMQERFSCRNVITSSYWEWDTETEMLHFQAYKLTNTFFTPNIVDFTLLSFTMAYDQESSIAFSVIMKTTMEQRWGVKFSITILPHDSASHRDYPKQVEHIEALDFQKAVELTVGTTQFYTISMLEKRVFDKTIHVLELKETRR